MSRCCVLLICVLQFVFVEVYICMFRGFVVRSSALLHSHGWRGVGVLVPSVAACIPCCAAVFVAFEIGPVELAELGFQWSSLAGLLWHRDQYCTLWHRSFVPECDDNESLQCASCYCCPAVCACLLAVPTARHCSSVNLLGAQHACMLCVCTSFTCICIRVASCLRRAHVVIVMVLVLAHCCNVSLQDL